MTNSPAENRELIGARFNLEIRKYTAKETILHNCLAGNYQFGSRRLLNVSDHYQRTGLNNLMKKQVTGLFFFVSSYEYTNWLFK